jgi:hypothetical protein
LEQLQEEETSTIRRQALLETAAHQFQDLEWLRQEVLNHQEIMMVQEALLLEVLRLEVLRLETLHQDQAIHRDHLIHLEVLHLDHTNLQEAMNRQEVTTLLVHQEAEVTLAAEAATTEAEEAEDADK